jgi:flagellar protein FlaJ
MAWYKFWEKGNKPAVGKGFKGFTSTVALDMDFFCQLSYMAAVSTSGISRSGLFYHSAKLPYLSAQYFKKVDFVAKAFNHDYSEACNIVGQATKEPEVKALLLRLSGALSSGEDIPTFLERESQVFSDSYSNRYERRLEVLRKWADAYVALILTSAIVTVMAVVTLMIGNVTTSFIVALSILTIIVTILGSWLIYNAAPKENKVHSLPNRTKEQNLVRILTKITLPIAGVIVLFLLVMKVNIGWPLLVTSIFLFPIGLISWIDDKKIDKRDVDIAGFLRSLGGVGQAIGATVNEAISRLDFRSLGALKESVDLLYSRLKAGIEPTLCWDRFVGETGSEQVSRSVRIFWDGVAFGGDPQRVGNDASNFAMKIALLRTQRGLIASGLLWLTMIMHIVLTALLIFIYQTLILFTDLVQSIVQEEGSTPALANLPSFGIFAGDSVELSLLYFMVALIVIILAFANSFAIYAASGGHIYKLAFYLSITMAISGAALVFVPSLVQMMFEAIL